MSYEIHETIETKKTKKYQLLEKELKTNLILPVYEEANNYRMSYYLIIRTHKIKIKQREYISDNYDNNSAVT